MAWDRSMARFVLLSATSVAVAATLLIAGFPSGPAAVQAQLLAEPQDPATPPTRPAGDETRDLVSIQLPAGVFPFAPAVHNHAYAAFDAAGNPLPAKTWRVAHGTGNCCENYVGSTAAGRLLDFGGTYLAYSDNAGLTWSQVRPAEPQLSGEGAVVTAPNGDILGIGWDPYTGDHLLSYKYTAASMTWDYQELPIHTPFFDREWLGVIPGPVTIGLITAPYVGVLKGGWPSKEVWYFSMDGLNYALADSRAVDVLVNAAAAGWVAPAAAASHDWIQAHVDMGLTPLGVASALAARVDYPGAGGCYWRTTTPTLSWRCQNFPLNPPAGPIQSDSLGRLHQVVLGAGAFTYRMSGNGGAGWASIVVPLPPGYSVENLDFKVSGALGLSAVALHTHKAVPNADEDLLYKIDVTGAAPLLLNRFVIGLGNLNADSGVTGSARFDFSTVTILSTGKMAVSFIDTAHSPPAVAIEL